MLRILGSPKTLCDGLTRRDMLQAGALGALGLSLADYFRLSAAQTAPASPQRSFGQAKSCILLYLYGAPSQLETFDPKPDAPLEIRGDFGSIETVLPGVSVSELLPRISRVLDRMTIVRSVTHPYPLHGVAYALTGIPRIEVAQELNPRDSGHWPFLGSLVDHLDGLRDPAVPDVPRNLLLPFAFSSQRVGEVPRAGPYGGFLGATADPIATEFRGRATVQASKTLAEKTWEDLEPYRGIDPDGRLTLPGLEDRGPGAAFDGLERRKSL